MNEKSYEEVTVRALVEGCLTMVAVVTAMLLTLLLCAACRTEYVPVETVRVETARVTDTVLVTDTMRVERETVVREATAGDSALLSKLGLKLGEQGRLMLVLQRELEKTRSEKSTWHSDTVVKTERVEVPVPVERQLSRWERVCLDYGKVMLGGSVACVVLLGVVIVRWMRRRFGRA